ncbi:MAG: HD domain-containing phosphohydrolase [Halieaceae bacterium]|jgi:HD-GYP domain-containing protein (c-di-GMP phosphodiesterase class II)|nr:HD domain-containing phosphohydrolase [Halieaceae bacterium]
MNEDSETYRPDLTEILSSDLQAFVDDILHTEGGIDHFRELLSAEQINTLENRRKLDLVTRAGVSFTRERDINNILEITLNTARKLTNSDGGTIYMLHEEFANDPIDPGKLSHRELRFVALQNETMNTFLKGDAIDMMPPVPLDIDGEPNLANVSAYCANTREMLNFEDVYNAEGFSFDGTRAYDEANHYRSKSMLVIPLEDHENNVIGVLQLINRRDSEGDISTYTDQDIELVQSVSFPAAASITTQRLIDEQATLFNAFVTVLAEGLGEKSPHTYNHIRRVAALGEALSESLHNWDEGLYQEVRFSEEDMAEMRLAGWLHDIGKITTPEHIVSKQVKLQFVMDRFEMIAERFSSRLKDLRIEALERKLAAQQAGADAAALDAIDSEYQQQADTLADKLQQLFRANRGGEFVTDEAKALISELAEVPVTRHFRAEVVIDHGYPLVKQVEPTDEPGRLVDDWEKENLLIERGTLNKAERDAINLHADRSWRWLMALPFPRKQKRLPLYAGAHHEHLNGTGYPNGIDGKDMPIQSRILAIADIYEALVANDRPYKEPMKLSVALDILGKMVNEQKLDGELMRIFLLSGDYMKFAEEYLDADQIDDVDVDAWLAQYYVPPQPPTLV